MSRRTALHAIAALVATHTAPSFGATMCGPFFPNGLQLCESGISSNLIYISARDSNQNYSQLCWAACIRMIFRYHGYYVSQRRIVADTWGELANVPAQPWQINANLNRLWTDDKGSNFQVMGDIFTANPVTAAQDLSQDEPLIIGTIGNAIALISLVYVCTANGGGEVVSAIVRDPWPGKGRRDLCREEWYSTSFPARVPVV